MLDSMNDNPATMGAGSAANMDDSPDPAKSDPLPPPNGRRRWLDTPIARDPAHGKLGGVIAGLARAYGFDPKLVRILFALLCFPFPPLVLVYLGAWALLPASPESATSPRRLVHNGGRLSAGAIVLLAFVALTIFVATDTPFHVHGLSWGLALILIGVLLWVGIDRSHDQHEHHEVSNAPLAGAAPPAPPSTASGFARPHTASATWAPPTVQSPWRDAPVDTPQRRRYPIASIGLALTFIGVAMAAAGNSFDWWNLSVLGTAVTVLIVVFALVVASAIVNRRVVLVATTAPILALGAITLLVTNPDLSGGIGERTANPITVADAAVPQRLAIGQLTLDLRAIAAGADAATTAVNVDAHVGIGRLHILVPRTAELELHGNTGGGSIRVDGNERSSGLRVHDDSVIIAPAGPVTERIVLNARVGIGDLSIDHR